MVRALSLQMNKGAGYSVVECWTRNFYCYKELPEIKSLCIVIHWFERVYVSESWAFINRECRTAIWGTLTEVITVLTVDTSRDAFPGDIGASTVVTKPLLHQSFVFMEEYTQARNQWAALIVLIGRPITATWGDTLWASTIIFIKI